MYRRPGTRVPWEPPAVSVPPSLQWFLENYRTISDALARGYSPEIVGFDETLARPTQTLARVLDGLGVELGGGTRVLRDAAALIEPRQPPSEARLRRASGEHDVAFDTFYDLLVGGATGLEVVQRFAPLHRALSATLPEATGQWGLT